MSDPGMPQEPQGLRVVVEGCCHGELDKIYETMRHMEEQDGKKIDLLLCCGDFQAVRNLDDLECMACPPKYRHLATFYKYYSGEKVAPYPTIFIGGNHEATNHLWELFHGGWVAPNIFFLGYAGVVRFGGLRIGGLSGIFNSRHYHQGHHERPPYTDSTMRSAYHIRAFDVHRLLSLSPPLDIFLSHDWPAGIALHGDTNALLRRKPFLRREVHDGSLGSPPAAQLLAALRPLYWFSAHMHTKFAALVPHPQGAPTRFLALDKCLPGREFLQVVDLPQATGPRQLAFDEEWLAVVRATHAATCLRPRAPPPPQPQRPSPQQLAEVRRVLEERGGSHVPLNFQPTAPSHDPGGPQRGRMPRAPLRSPQTEAFLHMLGLQYNLEYSLNPAPPLAAGGRAAAAAAGQPNPEEIDIDEDDGVLDDDVAGDNPEEIALGSDGEGGAGAEEGDPIHPGLAAVIMGVI